jgi:hypothetical protein
VCDQETSCDEEAIARAGLQSRGDDDDDDDDEEEDDEADNNNDNNNKWLIRG